MTSPGTSIEFQTRQRETMTSFIQIAALVVLVGLCIMVVGPFFGLVVWGVILAIAIFPLHLRLAATLGGSRKTSATLITLIGLVILVVPGWLVTSSSIDTAQSLAADLRNDSLSIRPPPDGVADWPIVGTGIYAAWSEASENVGEFVETYRSQVRSVVEWLVGAGSALLFGLLHFIVSVIIAGVLLMYPDESYELSRRVFERIATGRGEHLTRLSVATVRSVTNGVLGVAAIQAALAGIGFAVVGLPAPGILTLLVLVTAIVQIPAIVIMLPLIVWVFSFASPVAAGVFAVYAILVALSDNVLKPLLLGRGVDLPVLIVLIGAIGGMIEFGVVGLFIGAVILGLGNRIIADWIWGGDDAADRAASVGDR